MKLIYRKDKRPIDEFGVEHKLCFGTFSKDIHSCQMCNEKIKCCKYQQENEESNGK